MTSQKIVPILTLLNALAAQSCQKPSSESFLVEYDQSQVYVTVQSSPPGTNSQEFADLIGRKAIDYRRDLALEFIGEEVPPFPERMPILVQFGQSSGLTSYSHGPQSAPNRYKMTVIGPTEEAIVANTLRHEVMHTVISAHVKGASARWLDEGLSSIVTTTENFGRLRLKLDESLRGQATFIPFSELMPMNNYPKDILALYYEGSVMADYLYRRADGGPKKLMRFLKKAVETAENNKNPDLAQWNRLLQEFYNLADANAFEKEVKSWFLAGSPNSFKGEDESRSETLLANAKIFIGPLSSSRKQIILLASPEKGEIKLCLSPKGNAAVAQNCPDQEKISFTRNHLRSQGNYIYQIEWPRPLSASDSLFLESTTGESRSFQLGI